MNHTLTTGERNTGEVQARREQEQKNRWLQPEVNIVETKDGYVLEAEMPGVNKVGLEIQLEGNQLTIVGRRTRFGGEAKALYRESYDYDFRRSFELDPTIDQEHITARMDHGVLFLELPKAEKVKPRKIKVD